MPKKVELGFLFICVFLLLYALCRKLLIDPFTNNLVWCFRLLIAASIRFRLFILCQTHFSGHLLRQIRLECNVEYCSSHCPTKLPPVIDIGSILPSIFIVDSEGVFDSEGKNSVFELEIASGGLYFLPLVLHPTELGFK